VIPSARTALWPAITTPSSIIAASSTSRSDRLNSSSSFFRVIATK
jgi:hypothetical protein